MRIFEVARKANRNLTTNYMKRNIFTFLLLMAISLTGCKTSPKGQEVAESQPKDTTVQEQQPVVKGFDYSTLPEEPTFLIKTSEGDITVKLYKETPLHRDNFIKLVSKKYYNNIRFHRIINGFMIQAGDPYTKSPGNEDKIGTGGPGYTIPAEFVAGKTHKKGALAAARRGGEANPLKESSGSQFYIVQNEENCKHLDGEYTIFGETIDGFDVIDKIAAAPKDKRDKPLTDIIILKIVPVVDGVPVDDAIMGSPAAQNGREAPIALDKNAPATVTK